MQTNHRFPILAGYLLGCAAALMVPSIRSEESFLALGKVGSNGTLASSASRAGAAVVSSRLGAGSYEVSIVQMGAFQNADIDDHVVQAGIESNASSDVGITANIASITDDTLVIQFHTADLENVGTPDDPVSVDQAFYFAVRNSPFSAKIDGDSRHLLAVGVCDEPSYSLPTHVAVGGGTLRASRSSTGNIELSFEQAGAFANDEGDDYLIFLTSLEGGTEDEILRGGVTSTLLDSSVTFTVRNDDVQANPAGNAGVPADGDFAFAIFRATAAQKTGVPASRLIALTASVAGSDGSKKNGSASRPGSTVISTRSSQGVYTVQLVSPGAFRNTQGKEFAPIVTVRGELLDRVASAQCSVINEDTLQVTVRIKDVQVSGQAEGVLVDNDFDIVVYDLDAEYGADLAIGSSKSPAALRYFGRHGREFVTLKLRDTDWGKFYIGAENIGRSLDGMEVSVGYDPIVKERYFQLGRSRLNVTAKVRVGGIPISFIRPGERILIEGRVRYKSAKERDPIKKYFTGFSSISYSRSPGTTYIRVLPK